MKDSEVYRRAARNCEDGMAEGLSGFPPYYLGERDGYHDGGLRDQYMQLFGNGTQILYGKHGVLALLFMSAMCEAEGR